MHPVIPEAGLPTAPQIATPAGRGLFLQLTGAALLALVVLYGVAFAESPLAHNAAHDMRHVTVRPCH